MDRTRRVDIREANMYFLVEATIALSVSFIINLFVMAVFGQAFYQQTNEEAVSLAIPVSPPSHLPSSLAMGFRSHGHISQSLCWTLGSRVLSPHRLNSEETGVKHFVTATELLL